jgi:hypothetical protein
MTQKQNISLPLATLPPARIIVIVIVWDFKQVTTVKISDEAKAF